MSVHGQPAGGADKDYEQSDAKHLLKVRRWRSYHEIVEWLRRELTR